MNKQEIKDFLRQQGADLCGVAGMDRFADAPEGYHPLDVMPACKSVIAFACRFPVGTLSCRSAMPYTQIRNSISDKMNSIALNLCIELEKHQILAAPIPAVEDEVDDRTGRMRSIVSIKHAAQAAGLGTIGRHSLLITPEFGSMVWLGAVLTEAQLEPDELKSPICNHCNLCVKSCPVQALESEELKQYECRDHAFGVDHGTWQIKCHKCRDICPYNLGSENRQLRREVLC